MKKLSFTIALTLCILVSFSQVNQTKVRLGYLTANFENPSFVNGKLKEMTQVSYEAKLEDGKVVKGKVRNDRAAMTNVSLRHATFKFNELGELIHASLFNNDGAVLWQAVVDNDKGEIKKVFFLKDDTLLQFNRFVYDDNLLKEIHFCDPENNTVVGKQVFQYDENGNRLNTLYFDSNGEKTSYTEFKREENGRIKTSTYKNKNEIITNQTEYFYGSDHFEPVSMDTKITNGQPTDVKGRREHVFDENGNWIKQIRYRNNEPLNITERIYTYYK